MNRYAYLVGPFALLLLSEAAAGMDEWIDNVVKNGVVGNGYSHGQYPSFGSRTHPGIDIGGGCNLEVIVPASGEVVRVVDNADPRFTSVGNAVVIRHGEGEAAVFSAYFHLASTPRVGKGPVYLGQSIGQTGETGFADGCHLHFEVRNFEGIDFLFHPEFANIYLAGNQSESAVLKNDWIDPIEWVNKVSVPAFGETDLLGVWEPIPSPTRPEVRGGRLRFEEAGGSAEYSESGEVRLREFEVKTDGQLVNRKANSANESVTPFEVRGYTLILKYPHAMFEAWYRRVSGPVSVDRNQRIADQVGSALNGPLTVRRMIEAYYFQNGKLPVSNSDGGMSEPEEMKFNFTSSITIRDGDMIVELGGIDAMPEVKGMTLTFSPRVNNNVFTWSCSSEDIDPAYLPSMCK